MYTLLFIKKMTNKDLLYSTGDCTQYFAMVYMGKESKNEWIYVFLYTYICVSIYTYISDSLCCTPGTNTTL